MQRQAASLTLAASLTMLTLCLLQTHGQTKRLKRCWSSSSSTRVQVCYGSGGELAISFGWPVQLLSGIELQHTSDLVGRFM